MSTAMPIHVHLATMLILSAAAAANVFTEPAIFERLSHFKDYGVPGTVNDPLNQAMIADASCRNFDDYTGFSFYHDLPKVKQVLAALAELPSTANPSHFTLTAHKNMVKACGPPTPKLPNSSDYRCDVLPLPSLTGSMDNWHRALCAAENDPSWDGTYDPAYQPQQVAVTAGFMCIVACDCASAELTSTTLKRFASSALLAKITNEEVCKAIPFNAVNFTAQASTPSQLAKAAAPLQRVCGCDDRTAASDPPSSGSGAGFTAEPSTAGLSAGLTAVAAGLSFLALIAIVLAHRSKRRTLEPSPIFLMSASPNVCDDTLSLYEA
jgi:hypothetical protein